MLNMNSVADVFLGISQNIFRTAILKENLSMDIPHFIHPYFTQSCEQLKKCVTDKYFEKKC